MNSNDLGNFIHDCDSIKVKIAKFEKSLFDFYNANEIKNIYSFYLNDGGTNELCKSFCEYG